MKITLEKAPEGCSTEAEYRQLTSADVRDKRKLLRGGDGELARDVVPSDVGDFRIILTRLPPRKRLHITLKEVDTFAEASKNLGSPQLGLYIHRKNSSGCAGYQHETWKTDDEVWLKATIEYIDAE